MKKKRKVVYSYPSGNRWLTKTFKTQEEGLAFGKKLKKQGKVYRSWWDY